jgi:DNA-binding NarL/FixJ family response regulator
MIDKQKCPKSILIVAPPGDLQAGLQILMAKLPAVETLTVADAQAALAAVARHQPTLMILDSDILCDEPLLPVRRIKEAWPSVLCLVLSSHPKERRQALINGADAALVKGFPAARLAAAVEQLLETGRVE